MMKTPNSAPAAAPLHCLVLFDIDGTLIAGPKNGTSAGERAMSAAAVAATGHPSPFTGADYAGRTDRQIAKMLLKAGGQASPSGRHIDMLISDYIAALATEVVATPYRPLGDPRAAVTALREAGAVAGLGTGNVRSGAGLKLASAGIADLFDLERGGFGEDGETRAALLTRGAALLDPSRRLPVVIIGDTPHDIHGAKEMGAFCVGVPFGRHTHTELVDAGADAVINAIGADLPAVVRPLFKAPATCG